LCGRRRGLLRGLLRAEERGAAAAKATMRPATSRPRIGDAIPLVILLVPQHLVHASNFDRLVCLNVRRKFVDQFVLRGAVRLEELVNHVDGALDDA
jgi:hypothetical protein